MSTARIMVLGQSESDNLLVCNSIQKKITLSNNEEIRISISHKNKFHTLSSQMDMLCNTDPIDIFIICFDIASKFSLQAAKNLSQYFSIKVPIIILGINLEARERKQKIGNPVSYTEALEFARDIGAVTYHECSFHPAKGVKCISAIISYLLENKYQSICCIS